MKKTWVRMNTMNRGTSGRTDSLTPRMFITVMNRSARNAK